MKNIVIFGDSYSTFARNIPNNYDTYYPNLDVLEVSQTWWSLLSEETNAKIILNDSWSGSTVCNTGYNNVDCSKSSSFIHRLDLLIRQEFFATNKVDKVFVFGGTNDSWTGNLCGKPKYCDWSADDLHTVLPGYAYFVHRLLSVVPVDKIHVIVNCELREDVTQGIVDICNHYGVNYTMLSDIDKQLGHPTAKGMAQIKNQVLSTIKGR